MSAASILCSTCQKVLADAPMRCAGCKQTYYCDRTCQAAHWTKNHRQICPALKAIEVSGFVKVVIQEGSGPQPAAGSRCTLHYEGTLLNGKVFDASRPKGRTFSFNVGRGEVIKAWDQGVAQMKVGERAYLVASPGYAYGAHSPPPIPPNSVLVFDVELLSTE